MAKKLTNSNKCINIKLISNKVNNMLPVDENNSCPVVQTIENTINTVSSFMAIIRPSIPHKTQKTGVLKWTNGA